MNTEENKIEASPIVNFEDKEYKIEDLSNTSKYFTSQLSDLQIKESKLRFELDQVLAAKEVMINKFRQSLNEGDNEKLN